MASRIIQKKGQIIAYLPNIRAAVKHFRSFSSYNEQKYSRYYVEDSTSKIPATQTVWSDVNLGPFGEDKRFPLPGLVGPCNQQKPSLSVQPIIDPERVLPQQPVERHTTILDQLVTRIDETNRNEETLAGTSTPNPADLLECVAYDSPRLMKKDFSDLFPHKRIMEDNLTIITISHKTENDMSGWSSKVEDEREQLLKTFIEGAKEICEALETAGYWADFIDPSSGKPFHGPHTNATLFETDERYKKLGFEIEDLGCCKVIHHHLWGTHSYVGCLFTNAPMDHPIISEMHRT